MVTSPLGVLTTSECRISCVAANPYIKVGKPERKKIRDYTWTLNRGIGSTRFVKKKPVASLHRPKKLTEVDELDELEELVVETQILGRSSGAVVLDVGKTSGPEDVIIALANGPVEVRKSSLVVDDVGVAHEVRGPGRLARLLQVAREDLERVIKIPGLLRNG